MTLAYNGTNFCGWQIQKNDRTVQQVLQDALTALHKHPVIVTGSGRTDSGVHAIGQAAHFDTTLASIPAEKFIPALNTLLPEDIRIRKSVEVPETFHARFHAVEREYRYYISLLSENNPFTRPFTHTVADMPAVRLLNTYARIIAGTHDFTTFSAAGDTSKTKIRNIGSAAFYMEKGQLVFRIKGNAFLWRMVRSLVGTMLELAQKSESPEKMLEILNAADRRFAGTTAPAKGLFLYRVSYA
ncbi:MAG: tRNA pseudouridine(38-40) synthase TruA [Spirochaetia bacterium]|nr:tRNA pseudouridine(38-40) synthase TruA [Spirochaetia bacterium]